MLLLQYSTDFQASFKRETFLSCNIIPINGALSCSCTRQETHPRKFLNDSRTLSRRDQRLGTSRAREEPSERKAISVTKIVCEVAFGGTKGSRVGGCVRSLAEFRAVHSNEA